jgi:hypothetical protein
VLKIFDNSKIKINEMGGECSMYGEKSAYGVSVANIREEDHLKGLSIDGRTILKWIFKEWDGRQGLD